MSSRTTLSEILERLAAGALVLTPNARAAAALREAYDGQQARLHAVWEPANVLSWEQWTQSLYANLMVSGQEERLLLNHAQEQLLWREVIDNDETQRRLAPPDALAGLAASAWSLAAAYNATSRLRSSANTHDARTFAGWAANFQSRCERGKLLTTAELEAALLRHLQAGRLAFPSTLTLCGLSEITPAQDELLLALERAGGNIEVVHLEAEVTAEAGAEGVLRGSVILPGEREELIFAARWIRQLLERDPTATVAVLVPDVAAERPAFEPILREVLTPELQDIGADLSSTPWEFAGGKPLAHTGLVADALDLARWVRSPLALTRISALLLSPYLGGADCRDALARFDAYTLQATTLLRPELDLRSTLALTRRAQAPAEAASFLGPISEAATDLLAGTPRRSYAEWTESLRRLLHAAGWPGPRPLTPAEYQASLAFDATLDLVATLDFSGRRVTFTEACEAVERQLAATPAPASAAPARVKVLTPTQAEGQVFTASLILRATDANYPGMARPNPLLDWTLQRNLHMPGAEAQEASEASRERLARRIASSNQTLFLTASHNASGPLRSSSFIEGFSFKPMQEKELIGNALPAKQIAPQLFPDTTPLQALPSTEIAGGSRLLKLQAACGFLAFAEMRLGGRELETQEPGFDAIESGNVLHRALEHFWSNTRSQERLRDMSEGERIAALTAAIDFAINARVHDRWDEAFLALQKDRMLALLNKWLDVELQRGPFTVLSNEEKLQIEVGPLSLSVRMDRIDELPDGGFVLVDYKTGMSARTSSWTSDRPEEPQLPLYALATGVGELRGLAFARVRAGEDMQWTGYADEPGILPKKGSKLVDLAYETEQWRAILTQLAQDFHDGHTDVAPKSFAINCTRCAQRLLCRLDVTSVLANADEGSADEEPADV